MTIAKKEIGNTPILPNFSIDPFYTSKLILEDSYTFVLFLQWIYILTNERNLQNEHSGRNYFNFGLKMIPYFTEFENGSFFDVKVKTGKLLCFCFVSKILVLKWYFKLRICRPRERSYGWDVELRSQEYFKAWQRHSRYLP